MLAHRVELSVFVREEDFARKEDFLLALRSLVPFQLEEEKVAVESQTAQGFNEKRILIARIVLQKARHVRAFLEHLSKRLSPAQKALLREQAASRLDAENSFFMRFDREALLEKRLHLTDSGACYHVKIGIAVFPATSEAALAAIDEWLGGKTT